MTLPSPLAPLSTRQQQLAAELVPLITQIAEHTASIFPGIAFDDIVGGGHDAVVGVVQRFDPDDGTPLWGYARPRLQYAMYDTALRERRPLARELARLMDAEIRLPAEPTAEPATLSSMVEGPPPREIAVGRARAKAASLFTTLYLERIKDEGEDAYIAIETRERGFAALSEAVAALDDPERALVAALYADKLTIDEAAKRLRLDRTAVRRAHKRVKQKLARLLRRAGVNAPVTAEE